MTLRNVPLAVRRAEANDLDLRLKEHRGSCYSCRPRQPCEEARDMRAELNQAREDIRHWFDPGPDQGHFVLTVERLPADG